MPEAYLFQRGFNFVEGTKIGNYILTKCSISEHSVIKYHKYSYNITITLKPIDSYHSNQHEIDIMDKQLSDIIKSNRIIRSSHGTPYNCSLFEDQNPIVNVNNEVTYYLSGLATK